MNYMQQVANKYCIFISVLTTTRRSSPPEPAQSYSLSFCFSKSLLILSWHLRLGLPSDPFPLGFPTWTQFRFFPLIVYMPLPFRFFPLMCYMPLPLRFSPSCATCPSHFVFPPHVLHAPPIHPPPFDYVDQRNFQLIFEIRPLCLPLKQLLLLRFHLSCTHFSSLYYSSLFYSMPCLLESVSSHSFCPKWFVKVIRFLQGALLWRRRMLQPS